MDPQQTSVSPPSSSGKKLKWLLWAIFIILSLLGGSAYWQHTQHYPSTDNTYVQANIVQVAPLISGPVINLYVKNYSHVRKGDAILDIDPAPFSYAVNSISAQLDSAKQDILAQQSAIRAAEDLVTQRQTELAFAKKTYERTLYLARKGQTTTASADTATNNLHVAEAAFNVASHQLQQAKAQLGNEDENNVHIRYFSAQLAQAALDLKNTHIIAPTNGYIVNLTARPGTMLRQGVAAFAIVDVSEWWVEANFKETQLKRIRTGQPATIVVDIYPNHTFHGIVENVSYGSGTAFSLFPPENATGNWVKVTQRFPVKIVITDPHPDYPLRVGASAAVEIDTNR